MIELCNRLCVRGSSCDKFGEGCSVSRLRRIAPWPLLGPISGLLAEGFYRNLRFGEPVLAALYFPAMILTWFDVVQFGKEAIEVLGYGVGELVP
jgi:hypothetical protein